VQPEQIQEDLKVQAAARVKEELALESLFRAQGYEVTEGDLAEAVLQLTGEDPDEAVRMRASLEANGALPILREQIMHRRALSWLVENVAVTEEEAS
jgi:trigger factor